MSLAGRFRWILPPLQVAIAVALFFYAPYQFRMGIEKLQSQYGSKLQLSDAYYPEHWPAPAQCISQGVNFPAFVLTTPLNFAWFSNLSLYAWGVKGGGFTLDVGDVVYFAWVAVLWFWLGYMLDHRLKPGNRAQRPGWRWSFITGKVVGLLFSLAAGALAIEIVRHPWTPCRSVGACGVAWSIGLGIYFGSRLVRGLSGVPDGGEAGEKYSRAEQ